MLNPAALVRGSLRFKAEAVLIVMSLVPLLALGLWSQGLVHRAVAVSVGHFHAQVAVRLADQTASYVADLQRRAAPGLAEADPSGPGWEARLRQVCRSYPDIRSAVLLDDRGRARAEFRSGARYDARSLADCRAKAQPVCWAPSSAGGPALLELRLPLRAGIHP